jgi:hypothetical protein
MGNTAAGHCQETLCLEYSCRLFPLPSRLKSNRRSDPTEMSAILNNASSGSERGCGSTSGKVFLPAQVVVFPS